MRRIKLKFYLLLIFFAFACCKQSFAQSDRVVDSLMNILKTATEDTGKVNGLNALGRRFWETKQYEEGRKYSNEALLLAEKLAYKKGIAFAYNNIGLTYLHQGKYPEAIKNLLTAVKIREEIGDKPGASNSYENLAAAYDDQGN